jgi:Fe-S-cluster containining protein
MKKTIREGKCIFLEGAGCSIYAIRPLVCRFYPFELTTVKNGKICFLYTGECPGIGRGKRLEREYFKNLFNLACEKLRMKDREPRQLSF